MLGETYGPFWQTCVFDAAVWAPSYHFTEALEFAHVPRISWISEMKEKCHGIARLLCCNIESQEPRNHGTLNIIWTVSAMFSYIFLDKIS